MFFYICASYSKRIKMRDVAWHIKKAGHVVTSKWIFGGSEKLEWKRASPRKHALRDLDDLRTADTLVYFSSPRGRGGKDVEYGYALHEGLELWVVGRGRHIFHALAHRRFKNTAKLLEAIRGL